MNQNVIKARGAVQALFSNPTTLQLKVTDYHVDQVAKLVECISDGIHPKEKMCLLDQVKLAKRLSRERNLLNYGDFESPDWSGENGWKTSPQVHITSDNPISKGHYLHMPGANQPQISDTVYPTYIYQTVAESKLKSYTRYHVRGFVGNSKDLELLVERYGKEVHVEMDVPNDIQYTLPMNECGGFERCDHESHHTCTCKDTTGVDTRCQCQDKMNLMTTGVDTNMPTTSDMYPNGYNAHKSCRCKDPHVFSFHIDTGCVDLEENVGLLFALKITSTDGVAKIDNLEIIEGQPLTREALARVKKREHKWKEEMKQKRCQTEEAVQAAHTAIDNLFTNKQYAFLKFDTLFPHILHADELVQRIPYVYHPFLQDAYPDVPGMNYDIFQQLSALVVQARGLYGMRNLVQNGTFSSGTGSWHVTDGVKTQLEGNTSVLVLIEWSDKALQHLRIDEERGYVLRVTARKEGNGNGYVVIHDCDHQQEKLTFTACDYSTMGASPGTQTTVLPATNCPPCHSGAWGEEMTMPVTMQSGYVTKTTEIFPDTDRIRIEIGETEGTFKIESVELICMEQMNEKNYPAVDVQPVATYMPTAQSDSISSTKSSVQPRHFHYAYAHDEYIDYVNPNWMAQISDNTTFSKLSIPGTHDTMAFYGGDISQCQTMSLTTQLNAGIRYLDIRCRHMDNIFYIYHGIAYQRARFEDVCNDVSAFLKTNSRETIFMRIKEESTPSNNTRSFAETFAVYKSQYSNLFWDANTYDPRLNEIRGKVVVLQDFSSDGNFGIPYRDLEIQDNYHLNSNWDLYDKWLDVKKHLYEADLSYKSDRNWIYLNYLSGSGGSFPYFVASGHSSPGTSAPRLSTGLTTPAFADWYPDFPRINCVGNTCTIAFEGTNILTNEWIEKSNFEYVGIIAADFPGGGLISNIIQINGGRVIQDGTYQIVTALNNSSVVDMDPSTKNVHLWQNGNAANQKWRFVYDQSRKAYQIRSVANLDLVLAWNDFGGSNNVFATSNQGYDEHYWFVIDAGNGYFYLQNKKNPIKVLDVTNSGTSNGTNIIVWNYNGGANQKFRIEGA